MVRDNENRMIELFLSRDKLTDAFDLDKQTQKRGNIKNIRKHLESVDSVLSEIFKKADKEDKANLIRVYTQSYSVIVDYFESWLLNPSERDANNLLHGILMIYAWMPRILRLHIEASSFYDDAKVAKLIDFLRKLKSYPEFDKNSENNVYSFLRNNSGQVSALKSIVDHSLTATAKILHFVRPADFPIWDSNIAERFGKTNSIKNYWGFLLSFENLRKEYESELNDVVKKYESCAYGQMKIARLVEQAIYLSSVGDKQKIQ